MEDKKILLNFASRSRPERLVSTITNILLNVESPNFIINLKLDLNDQSVRNNWIAKVLDLCDNIEIKWGFSKCKTDAINRNIPLTGWDIIVDVADDITPILNDKNIVNDMVFTKKGFDNIIRENVGKDDFVLFTEPYAKSQAKKGKNELISVMQVMGIDYYLRDKHLYNPAFKSLFCDNFSTNLAKLRGRYKLVDIEFYYHAHKAAGYGKGDELLRYTESFWQEDKQTYNRMMQKINEYV